VSKPSERPFIWYGTRGRGYCEACAKKAGARDKKVLSFKDPDRACSKCGARFIPFPPKPSPLDSFTRLIVNQARELVTGATQ